MERIELQYSPPEKLNLLSMAVPDENGIVTTFGLRPNYPELISAIEDIDDSFDISHIDVSDAGLPMLRNIITKPLGEYDKKVAHSLALLALCSKYKVRPFQHLIFDGEEPKINYAGYHLGGLSWDAFHNFTCNPNFFVDDSIKWYGIGIRDVGPGRIDSAKEAVKKWIDKGYICRELDINCNLRYLMPNYEGSPDDKVDIWAMKDRIVISGDFEMFREASLGITKGIESLLNGESNK